MLSRFEQFSSSISSIYQYIQKIERVEMSRYGLKGSHTQCLIAMQRFPKGITASQLCEVCDKDKAAISRSVADLIQKGLVVRQTQNGNTYRANLVLTEKGANAAEKISQLAALAAEKASADLTEEQRDFFYNALQLIATNLNNIYRNGLDAQDTI